MEAWKPPKQELVELLDRVADVHVQATRLKASAPVLFAGFQHPVPGPARLPSGDVPPAICNVNAAGLNKHVRERVPGGYCTSLVRQLRNATMTRSLARDRAINLMRETLTLLDQAGDEFAAMHVQWALDIAKRRPVKLKVLADHPKRQ